MTGYLEGSGLQPHLDALGFQTVGYGCTTCIGNSGPLPEAIGKAIEDHGLVAAAVLSGNRNFEARVHPSVRANYLASPLLVVAFALAGRIDLDVETEPLGTGKDGSPVFLRDIWPTRAGDQGHDGGGAQAGAVHQPVRQGVRRRRGVAGAAGAQPEAATRGTRTPRTCRSRRSSRT